MKCLFSNSFIKLDSSYDQHIKVTVSESMQRLPQNTVIFHKRPRLLSVIFNRRLKLQNIIVIVSRKFCLFKNLIESCLLSICRVYFLELYLKILIFLYNYDFIFIRILFIYYLFIYLFNLLIYFTYLSDIYQKYIYKKFIRLYFREWFMYYDL